MSLAQRITKHFNGSWSVESGRGHIPTPGHSAKDRGTTVKDDGKGGVVFGSFNGGDWRELKEQCERAGLLAPFNEQAAAWRVTGTYEYQDAAGNVVYRTVRKEKPGERKRFVAERLEGGRWVTGLGDVARVLYGLPRQMASDPAEVVCFFEGERKADKAAQMGFVSTAIAFGCKGWRKEYGAHFKGRTVAIFPDNDDPGRKFAAEVQAAIDKAGGKALLVDLPGLPSGGDIMDWTGSVAELRALIEADRPAPPIPAYKRGITAADLFAKRFEPVREIVHGLIAEGGYLFGGAPKIGKSWLAYQIALCVPTGRALFGSLPVEQGDCLYLALEDSERRLRSRLLKQGVTAPDRLTLATEWPDLDNGCIAELEAWADAVARPMLIIIDVLAMVRGVTRANESIYQADYRAMKGLAAFARARSIAVLVVHHVRKMASDDPLESLSGTNGLTGASDGVMVLKRDIGTGNCILYARGRDIEESERAVRFCPNIGTWELLGNADEVGRTSERQAILDTLREHGKPLTAREISDILGKNYDAVRRTLARMWKADEVQKEGRGSYTCPNCHNVPTAAEPDIVTHGTGGIGKDNRPRFPAPKLSEEVDFPAEDAAWHPNAALGRRRGRDGSILAPGETGDEPVPGWETRP